MSHNKRSARRALASLVLAMACNSSAFANTNWESIQGQKSIYLSNPKGEQVQIGTVEFKTVDDSSRSFKITLAEDRMQEYFLAMRPFKCVSGSTQQYCLFPVSNEPPVIRENDFTPLEYQLMFMKTKPNALHINPFNGLYYRLSLNLQGVLQGVQYELDMDPFITPDSVPLERRTRPIDPENLSPADVNSAWMPQLIIR